MLFVVAYDIADDRRRSRVFKVLKGFGVPAQESVFECELDPVRSEKLASLLQSLILPLADSVKIYPLCMTCRENARVLGLGRLWRVPDVLIC
jgi:CRISPR-associated protein Cas2